MARLGVGVLIGAQRDWATAGQDVQRYRETALSGGLTPRPPICLVNVSVSESHDEAKELAQVHMGAMFDSIDEHYHFADGHLQGVKGYEFYAKMAKTYAKFSDPQVKDKAVDFFVSLHAAGTPNEVLEQIGSMVRKSGMDHFVAQFSYGGVTQHKWRPNKLPLAPKAHPAAQKQHPLQANQFP